MIAMMMLILMAMVMQMNLHVERRQVWRVCLTRTAGLGWLRAYTNGKSSANPGNDDAIQKGEAVR